MFLSDMFRCFLLFSGNGHRRDQKGDFRVLKLQISNNFLRISKSHRDWMLSYRQLILKPAFPRERFISLHQNMFFSFRFCIFREGHHPLSFMSDVSVS